MLKSIADIIISRAFLIVLVLMVVAVMGVLLVRAPSSNESRSVVEHYLGAP